MVQWLRLHASNVGGVGGFPGWGTKIPHALQHDPKTWYMLCYMYFNTHTHRLPGWYRINNPPANAGDAGDMGSIPGSGRSAGEGNDNPLQYSYPENSMDRGVWQARVFGVAKCWTQLSTHTHRDTLIVSFCPPGGGACLPAPGFIVRCSGMGSWVSPPPSVELSSVCIFPASHQLCIPFMSSQLLWNVFGVENPLPAQIWNQKASIYVY